MERNMNKTILLVDDLQMFLEIERDFFQGTMVDILTAKDGFEALEVMRKNKVDLVFMDMQMPKMDGPTCCKIIKSDPELSHIPVVLITSSQGNKEKEICFAAGCNYFLTKPAGRERFIEIAWKFIPDIDRRAKRLPYNFECSIRCDDQTVPCSLYDLSADGAFVVTDYLGRPQDIVQLSFSLPDGTTIECPSKIVWVSGKDDARHPKGFGVKFALMAKDAKTSLAKFIKNQS
jgi:CheY-like chemotaxis protein